MELLKWAAYSLANRFIGAAKVELDVHEAREPAAPAHKYHWIFCSTIGELNGCKPLIQALAKQYPLVLITDRDCYADAFQTHFPEASVVELQGWEGESAALARHYPPASMTLCEIPILPNDAPCRLSYGFLRYLKQQRIPIFAVNGWLYEYAPSCRQDALERGLFTKDYVDLFNQITVQTPQVKNKLIAAGAKPDRIHVTGNMKFDAVKDKQLIFKDEQARQLVENLNGYEGKIIVAGSLAEEWEYALLAESFAQFLSSYTDSMLIMVPRHPEKQSQLDEIEKILTGLSLPFEFRSAISGVPDPDTRVIVLDTFGELRGMYSVCDFAYIGRNHNVLEPLTFGKPVVILDGWESTYPSYPVYEISLQHKLLTELSVPGKLGEQLLAMAQVDAVEQQENITSTLDGLATALDKNMKILTS